VSIASVSLFVELLRTRPLTLFWAMVAVQVVLWTLVPALFYSAPPGQLPVVLAIGHEFQFGTEFGPPLAFWLAEFAFRAAGLFGVYLLSQICIAATYGAVLSLGRAVVGDAHAAMAVLLMTGIAAFSVPTPEFGPAILAAPLWAWALYHFWVTTQRGPWLHWIALGVALGVLLLTTYAGLILVGLLVVYLSSSEFGRSQLGTVGPWAAGLVAIAILFPYLIWIDLAGPGSLPGIATVVENLRTWGWLVATLLIGHAGMGILIVLASGLLGRSRDAPPDVLRPLVDRSARGFVTFFALAPIVAMGLFALITHRPETFVGPPLVVLSGLAVIAVAPDRIRVEHQYLVGYAWSALLVMPPLLVALAMVIQPWALAIDLRVGRPASDMAQFFADSFQRRTGRPLAIVAGDPSTAGLVSLLAPTRPSLFLESAPAYLPRVSSQDIDDKGAVVVWPAIDPSGRPPPEISRQFPNLVPEVPRAFQRRFQGRLPLLRIGWSVIRPRSQAPVVPEIPPRPVPQPLPVQPLPQAEPPSPPQVQPRPVPPPPEPGIQPPPEPPPPRQQPLPQLPPRHGPE
jgi:hypothetical protein